jgi:hypothetical protein
MAHILHYIYGASSYVQERTSWSLAFPLRLYDRPYDPIPNIKLSPKTRIAASLIGAGMKVKDAADSVGLRKEYLSVLRSRNPEFRGAVTQTTDAIIEATTDPAEMIRRLCGPAVQKLKYLMESAEKEETVLKAAESVLDRGGYGKEQKISSSNLHISGSDLAALTNAMVESARIRADFAGHAAGFIAAEADMERRSDDPPAPNLAIHSGTARAAESIEEPAVARTGMGASGTEEGHAVPPREAGPPMAFVGLEF